MPTTRGTMARSRLIALALLAAAALPAVAYAAPGKVTLVRAAGALRRSRAGRARTSGACTGRRPGTPPRRGSAAAPTRSTPRPRPRIPTGCSRTPTAPQLYLGTALRRRLRQPRVPRLVDRAGERRRRRRGAASTSTTSRWSAAPTTPAATSPSVARPAHGRDDDRGELAALHGRLHGRAARRAPGRRDRPRRRSGPRATPAPTSCASSPPSSAVALEKPDRGLLAGPTAGSRSPAFVERRQAAGRGVVLDSYADAAAARLYGLATRCCSTPARCASATTPGPRASRYWSGYDVDLGAPLGDPRCAGASVLAPRLRGRHRARQPARQRHRARSTVGAGFADLDGVAQTELTLAPGTGARAPARPGARRPRRRRFRPVATPAPEPAAPVATATPTPPRKPVKRSGGAKAHIAGAAEPDGHQDSVTLTRTRVSGRVAGAVSGFTRVTVQRKRGERVGDRAPRQGLGVQARQLLRARSSRSRAAPTA